MCKRSSMSITSKANLSEEEYFDINQPSRGSSNKGKSFINSKRFYF